MENYATYELDIFESIDHPLQGSVHHSMASLRLGVLVRAVAGGAGEPDVVEGAEIPHGSAHELVASVRHDVAGRAEELDPLCHQGLRHRFGLLVRDEAGHLEPGVGVDHVENIRWSIFVSSVFLQIHTQNMPKGTGARQGYPGPRNPGVLHLADLAVLEILDGGQRGVIILARLHHQALELVWVGVAEDMVELVDLLPREGPLVTFPVLGDEDLLQLVLRPGEDVGHRGVLGEKVVDGGVAETGCPLLVAEVAARLVSLISD